MGFAVFLLPRAAELSKLEMIVNCQEMSDDLMSYAAGMLDPDEAAPLRQHLASGCPQCAGRLAEAEATLGLLALTLAPQTPSTQARSELISRVTSRQAGSSLRLVQPPAPWWEQLALSSAIAATIAAAITIFFVMRLKSGPTANPPGQANDLARTVAVLTRVLQDQHEEIQSMRLGEQPKVVEWASAPHLKTIWLAAMSNQPPTAHGRIWWDTDRSTWRLFADGMTEPPAGKIYELWFVSADLKTKLPAAEFTPDPAGDAEVEVRVPPSMTDTLKIAAVTDEPAKGVITSPTGSFQLMGSLQ